MSGSGLVITEDKILARQRKIYKIFKLYKKEINKLQYPPYRTNRMMREEAAKMLIETEGYIVILTYNNHL